MHVQFKSKTMQGTSTNQALTRLDVEQFPGPIQMVGCSVQGGFPSPAEDCGQERIDLAKQLVLHPACTYYFRVAGDSMKQAGIEGGDIIVVDRILQPEHMDIVVAMVDNEFTVKYLYKRPGVFKLKAANPTYPDILPKPEQVVEVWGVVTSCIKRFRKW